MTQVRLPATGVLRWLVLLTISLAGCGGSEPAELDPVTPLPTSRLTPATALTPAADTANPAGPPADTPATTNSPPVFPPNELGQIPILMYHQIGPVPDQFTRTPYQLRADLQWLYDQGFYVISMQDYLTNQIDIPAGKRPVILTFDDSPVSQFRLIPIEGGQLAIDPDSAVGILEAFYAAHPDFGRGGHFGVNTDRMFAWAPDADASDQEPYVQLKLQWLLDNGYELGNHTVDHANLAEIDEDAIKRQLAAANDAVLALVPDAQMNVITLPYGMYPSIGGDDLLRGFDYDGRSYAWDAALLVGANPANSPLSTAFNAYETARIQAFDDELNRWFQTFLDAPGLLYVSDGDPTIATVPTMLHPQLDGTLDRNRLGGRQLVRP